MTRDVHEDISFAVMLCYYSIHVRCGLYKLVYRHSSLYVQALECEHTVEYMASMFPQEFASEALLYIHRSALNLEQLVMKLQHHFEPLSKEVFGEK